MNNNIFEELHSILELHQSINSNNSIEYILYDLIEPSNYQLHKEFHLTLDGLKDIKINKNSYFNGLALEHFNSAVYNIQCIIELFFIDEINESIEKIHKMNDEKNMIDIVDYHALCHYINLLHNEVKDIRINFNEKKKTYFNLLESDIKYFSSNTIRNIYKTDNKNIFYNFLLQLRKNAIEQGKFAWINDHNNNLNENYYEKISKTNLYEVINVINVVEKNNVNYKDKFHKYSKNITSKYNKINYNKDKNEDIIIFNHKVGLKILTLMIELYSKLFNIQNSKSYTILHQFANQNIFYYIETIFDISIKNYTNTHSILSAKNININDI